MNAKNYIWLTKFNSFELLRHLRSDLFCNFLMIRIWMRMECISTKNIDFLISMGTMFDFLIPIFSLFFFLCFFFFTKKVLFLTHTHDLFVFLSFSSITHGCFPTSFLHFALIRSLFSAPLYKTKQLTGLSVFSMEMDLDHEKLSFFLKFWH